MYLGSLAHMKLKFLLFLLLPVLLYGFIHFYRPYGQRKTITERIASFKQAQHAETAVATLSPKLHDGDLIFQTSTSAQSQAIQLATHSPYSHCGILFKRGQEWRVFEAVQPVSETSLAHWTARGKGGRFVMKRLRDAETVLTSAALQRLQAAGEQYRGKSYDLYFGWSDDRIYCSELLWKMYQQATGREIGQLETLREFDLSHPAVQAKLKERYGNRIPLTEKVISPVRMFESKELVEVR